MTNMQIPTSYGVEVEIMVENLKEEDFWFHREIIWCDTRNHALYFNYKKHWSELLDLIEGDLDSYDENISHTIIKTSVIQAKEDIYYECVEREVA